MWTVTYEAAAIKGMMAADAKTRDRLRQRIEALAADPHARNNNIKKLQGMEGYRLRVGEWRILYRLVNEKMVVVVVDVDRRKDVYR